MLKEQSDAPLWKAVVVCDFFFSSQTAVFGFQGRGLWYIYVYIYLVLFPHSSPCVPFIYCFIYLLCIRISKQTPVFTAWGQFPWKWFMWPQLYCAVVVASVLLNCQTRESLVLIHRVTVCQFSDSGMCPAVDRRTVRERLTHSLRLLRLPCLLRLHLLSTPTCQPRC